MIAFLGLGGNLGDRQRNLELALGALELRQIKVVRKSSFYETAPRDYLDQPWFLNIVVAVETDLSPLALLEQVREVEAEAGRVRTVARGPRTVDVDILLYGDQRIALPELEIPHPRMWERRFVLEPLHEIAPNLVAPEALAAVADQEIRRLPD